jgi:predicted transcriptional regulator of viral defense system
MGKQHRDILAGLPNTFRFSEALQHINERQLRQLIADQEITPLARGLYRKSDWYGDQDLAEIAAKSPRATIALRSALASHNLIDDIPNAIDIAIPRGSWTPRTTIPIRWHHFNPETFDIGRETLDTGAARTIGIYNAERSIIDALRLNHREGGDTTMANQALKAWLRRGGQPSTLLQMARAFPRAQRALRATLDILL